MATATTTKILVRSIKDGKVKMVKIRVKAKAKASGLEKLLGPAGAKDSRAGKEKASSKSQTPKARLSSILQTPLEPKIVSGRRARASRRHSVIGRTDRRLTHHTRAR